MERMCGVWFLLPREPRGGHRDCEQSVRPKWQVLLASGDPKETYYIGPIEDTSIAHLNQWPSEELLPNWRPTMESLYWKLMAAGKNLLSLIAMPLNLEEDYFEKIGALNKAAAFLRLLHYPDYGMITLLITEGVPGLQGLNSEHWRNDGEVNKLSTLHRVMPTGKERYSVAFFFDPASDCVVECFESCCSESSPPRFPPIRSGDYLNERFRLTYGS
ncbi:2-oxoglutarate-Fe(II) type oxidoreductase hxnY [Glycine soja]